MEYVVTFKEEIYNVFVIQDSKDNFAKNKLISVNHNLVKIRLNAYQTQEVLNVPVHQAIQASFVKYVHYPAIVRHA